MRSRVHHRPPRVISTWGCARQDTCKEKRPSGNRVWFSWEAGLTDAGLCWSSYVSYGSVRSMCSLLLYQKNDKSIRRDRRAGGNVSGPPLGLGMLSRWCRGSARSTCFPSALLRGSRSVLYVVCPQSSQDAMGTLEINICD